MDKYIINGGKKLHGVVDVMAAKNAVLPIIACCIMIKDVVVLKGCERLTDVENMMRIIKNLGGRCDFDSNDLIIDCKKLSRHSVSHELTGALRSSVFILGPLLSRLHRAEISYPGGCDIGLRPIDLHLEGLKNLGVKLSEDEEKISCDGRNIHSGIISLAFPSVGATENLIMAATLASGRTVIRNAAAEPEIIDLQNFINAMGGNVHGAGSGVVIIDGVSSLHGGVYSPIRDRISAGTFLIGGAMCGGKVTVRGIRSDWLFSLTEKLRLAGAVVTEKLGEITVESDGALRILRKVETQPFPGFPTDLQAPITAMMSASKGRGYVIENLFENRFRHTRELKKMGADIIVCGRAATVRGAKLHGANVIAQDLRGGAALVLAGLKAEGKTEIIGLEHIDRGYYNFEEKITSLGGDIKRVKISCV